MHKSAVWLGYILLAGQFQIHIWVSPNLIIGNILELGDGEVLKKFSGVMVNKIKQYVKYQYYIETWMSLLMLQNTFFFSQRQKLICILQIVINFWRKKMFEVQERNKIKNIKWNSTEFKLSKGCFLSWLKFYSRIAWTFFLIN